MVTGVGGGGGSLWAGRQRARERERDGRTEIEKLEIVGGPLSLCA